MLFSHVYQKLTKIKVSILKYLRQNLTEKNNIVVRFFLMCIVGTGVLYTRVPWSGGNLSQWPWPWQDRCLLGYPTQPTQPPVSPAFLQSKWQLWALFSFFDHFWRFYVIIHVLLWFLTDCKNWWWKLSGHVRHVNTTLIKNLSVFIHIVYSIWIT